MLLLAVLLLAGCGREKKIESELLGIEEKDGYTLVTVRDPWKAGQTLHRYALVPRDKPLPGGLPDATVIKVPLRSAVVYSDVYARPIVELGCGNAIVGVLDAQYFKTPEVVAGLKSGKISDCGSSMSPSTERIVSAAPEAIFLSPMQNSGYGAIGNMGIPIVEMADYMESTPLNRARWIEFIGLLFGKSGQAAKVYAQVAKDYAEVKAVAQKADKHPMVISEYAINGVWYVPGGKATRLRFMPMPAQHIHGLPTSRLDRCRSTFRRCLTRLRKPTSGLSPSTDRRLTASQCLRFIRTTTVSARFPIMEFIMSIPPQAGFLRKHRSIPSVCFANT